MAINIHIYIYIYIYDYDFNLDLLGLGLSINFPKLLKNPFKIELQLDKLCKYSRGVKTYRPFIIYNIIVIIELQLLQASTALREKKKKKKFPLPGFEPRVYNYQELPMCTVDFIYIYHRFFIYLMLFQQAEKQSENFHFKHYTLNGLQIKP